MKRPASVKDIDLMLQRMWRKYRIEPAWMFVSTHNACVYLPREFLRACPRFTPSCRRPLPRVFAS